MAFFDPSNHIRPGSPPAFTPWSNFSSDSDTEEDNLDPVHLSHSLSSEQSASESSDRPSLNLQDRAASIEYIRVSTLSAQQPVNNAESSGTVDGTPIFSGRTPEVYASDAEYENQWKIYTDSDPTHGLLAPFASTSLTSPTTCSASLSTPTQPLSTRTHQLSAAVDRQDELSNPAEQSLREIRESMENQRREMEQSLREIRERIENPQREIEQRVREFRESMENQRREMEQRFREIRESAENDLRSDLRRPEQRQGKRIENAQRRPEQRQGKRIENAQRRPEQRQGERIENAQRRPEQRRGERIENAQRRPEQRLREMRARVENRQQELEQRLREIENSEARRVAELDNEVNALRSQVE